MVVRLRLQRFGLKALPFYRIVVADSRSKRDGKHIENLGTYDPLPDSSASKHVVLNFDRVKYWLSVGAQPTEKISRLLGMANITPEPTFMNSTRAPRPAAKK